MLLVPLVVLGGLACMVQAFRLTIQGQAVLPLILMGAFVTSVAYAFPHLG